jgi:hypothetical protein
MLNTKLAVVLLCAGVLAFGCSTARHHQGKMSDPKSFQGHFGDMDASGDDRVNWEEFKAYFPHAEPQVFNIIDMNGDKALDHDEWHAFKDAHGMRDHD